MKIFLISLVALLFAFSPVAFATSETFQVTTDGNGNFSGLETISFGKVTVQSFVANYSFANVKIKVDGVLAFDKATTAGVKETMSAAARKNFEVIGTGGPANTSVTVTIEYVLSPVRMVSDTRVEADRTAETFQVTTDGSGNFSAVENISFGKVTVTSFVANYSFGNVKVITDGTVAFNKATTANVKETMSAAARKKFEIAATGGPANASVTVTIEYTLSPVRADGTTVEMDRTAETFDITTDGNGNFSAVENISFGKATVTSFVANYSFGNVKVITDGTVAFNKATTANVKETMSAVARKKFEIAATGGPANATVTCTIEYTLSPFRSMK